MILSLLLGCHLVRFLCSVVNYYNASGGRNQLWWDDPITYAKKYAKVKDSGLRGLGMWTADSVGSDERIVAGMWDAIPNPDQR